MKRDPKSGFDPDRKPRRERKRVDGDNISRKVLDQLVEEAGGEEALRDPTALLRDLTAALVTRALETELDHHLGYETGEDPPEEQPNRRNGRNSKKLRTNQGEITVGVPRDREGSFEPQIVPKRQRHFDGFDDKIIAIQCAGHDGARHQGAAPRDLLRRREPRSHLEGHRRGERRAAQLAATPTGAGLLHRLPWAPWW